MLQFFFFSIDWFSCAVSWMLDHRFRSFTKGCLLHSSHRSHSHRTRTTGSDLRRIFCGQWILYMADGHKVLMCISIESFQNRWQYSWQQQKVYRSRPRFQQTIRITIAYGYVRAWVLWSSIETNAKVTILRRACSFFLLGYRSIGVASTSSELSSVESHVALLSFSS